MGTNFCVRVPPVCGGKCSTHCYGGEIHLGKSSAGWAFAFRAYPDPDQDDRPVPVTWPVTDYASWLKLLDLGEIYDEYGDPVTRNGLLAMITARRGGLNATRRELGDYLDSDEYRFVPREFS